MPRLLHLPRIRSVATDRIRSTLDRLGRIERSRPHLDDRRWANAMSLVSIHSAWERFAEHRLALELNHSPDHFLKTNIVKGIHSIPKGLALYLVRGGMNYFDFRSCSDLLSKGDKLLSPAGNPFRNITASSRNVLDCMAAIRNAVVHESDSAMDSYKKRLRNDFGIKSAPSPGEFLDSIDRRRNSPTMGRKRIYFFAHVVNSIVATV